MQAVVLMEPAEERASCSARAAAEPGAIINIQNWIMPRVHSEWDAVAQSQMERQNGVYYFLCEQQEMWYIEKFGKHLSVFYLTLMSLQI